MSKYSISHSLVWILWSAHMKLVAQHKEMNFFLVPEAALMCLQVTPTVVSSRGVCWFAWKECACVPPTCGWNGICYIILLQWRGFWSVPLSLTAWVRWPLLTHPKPIPSLKEVKSSVCSGMCWKAGKKVTYPELDGGFPACHCGFPLDPPACPHSPKTCKSG